MRVIVTGSRHWTDGLTIAVELHRLPPGPVTILHGDARGADEIASRLAESMCMDVKEYAADWTTHGNAAGPIRNQQMVDAGADLCLAFPLPGSKGTWDCVRRCRKAGIPVRIVK